METMIRVGITLFFAGIFLYLVWYLRAKASPKWGVLRTTLSLCAGFTVGAIIGYLVRIQDFILPTLAIGIFNAISSAKGWPLLRRVLEGRQYKLFWRIYIILFLVVGIGYLLDALVNRFS
ncbi:MAG: hypothetical protein ACKO4O_02060 [Candidatus Limnocylindrus sp.]